MKCKISGRKRGDVDNAFLRYLRPLLLATPDTRLPPFPYESVQNRFLELQSLRNDYNAANSAYEALESGLGQEERELEVLETRFFSAFYGVRRDDDQDGSESETFEVLEEEIIERPASRTSLLGISGQIQDDIHPLYRSLLDAVGDRELAHEHYRDLVSHRDAILNDLEATLMSWSVSKTGHYRTAEGMAPLAEDELEQLKSIVAHIPTNVSASELKSMVGSSLRTSDMDFLETFGREEEAAKRKLNEDHT